MKVAYLIFNWTLGIIFLLVGLNLIINAPIEINILLSAICFFIIAGLLLPPVRNFVYSKTNKELSGNTRIFLNIILLVVFLSIAGGEQDKKELAVKKVQEQADKAIKSQQKIADYFKANRLKIMESLKYSITLKEYDIVLSESNKYLFLKDKELESINTIAKTNKILKVLKNIPSKEIEKNKSLYQQLVALNPSNAKYKSKLKLYSNKVNYAKRNPFKEKDFYFDKKTKGYKKIIIAGVNKVYRENSRCKNIEPSSAYISSSKGSRSNPVFYVTCGKGNGVFNVFFSKSDIEKGKKFSAKKHINKSKATRICEGYAKSHANHPSSVNFSKFMDLSVYETPNGRTRVTSSFTAKNSFNLELKYKISCLLDSNGLIEGNISEAR